MIREITSPNIIGCIVTEELVNDPQLISVIAKTNLISIETLWSIINSKLATFYHFNSSPKATKGSFPKILVEDIKNFPLPKIDNTNQEILTKLVNEILTLKSQDPQADTLGLEQEIDAMVYELYGLSEEEIGIVENS